MEHEYKRDERMAAERFTISMGASSARLVREEDIDPAELRRKQMECSGTEGHYIDLFCERYHDRGIAGRMHRDAAELEKKEALGRASAPGTYVQAERLAKKTAGAKRKSAEDSRREGDARSGEVSDTYRSGVSDGRRYMTVDDFARYYHDQRGYKFPQYRQAVTDDERIAAVRAVAPTRETRLDQPKKAGWLTDTDKFPAFLRKFMNRPALVRLNEWAGETFPREGEMRVETRESGLGRTRRIPAGLVAALVTVVVSMSMVISSTVLVSQSTQELSQKKEELAELQEARGELSDQLTLKNDALDIEDKATNELGLVPEQYLDGAYITEENEDYLEVFDEDRDGGKKTGLAWLLSAFGWGN